MDKLYAWCCACKCDACACDSCFVEIKSDEGALRTELVAYEACVSGATERGIYHSVVRLDIECVYAFM
jgi:hypothetical protein